MDKSYMGFIFVLGIPVAILVVFLIFLGISISINSYRKRKRIRSGDVLLSREEVTAELAKREMQIVKLTPEGMIPCIIDKCVWKSDCQKMLDMVKGISDFETKREIILSFIDRNGKWE